MQNGFLAAIAWAEERKGGQWEEKGNGERREKLL